MASKWINKNLFSDYVNEKQKETDTTPSTLRRMDYVWQSPKAGTADKAKVYEGRFLPDLKGRFTKKYFYHMWKSGEKWIFFLCPKSHGMEEFCPVCSIVSSLYKGTADDKALAFRMKRKERHVGNFYVADDPRDKEIEDDAKKASGKVKLYEFPSKLESKLKNEILDKKEGLGLSIFDPGAEGHNIIIKIKSTKQDAKGNTYPDYSDSIFSRNASPLATSDAGIKKIMEGTHSIDDYISSMEMSEEDTIAMLKNEMLWDMVENEWNRSKGSSITPNVASTKKSVKEEEDDIPEDVDNLTDEDLMRELKAMS